MTLAGGGGGGSTKVEQLNTGWKALLSNIEVFNEYKLVVALLMQFVEYLQESSVNDCQDNIVLAKRRQAKIAVK